MNLDQREVGCATADVRDQSHRLLRHQGFEVTRGRDRLEFELDRFEAHLSQLRFQSTLGASVSRVVAIHEMRRPPLYDVLELAVESRLSARFEDANEMRDDGPQRHQFGADLGRFVHQRSP
ncbi:MAG: hypothetical protein AAF456_25030, partial [Planctomycetota bacterium]